MYKNSKVIVKKNVNKKGNAKIDKNGLDKYFEKKTNDIFLERLNEEIQEHRIGHTESEVENVVQNEVNELAQSDLTQLKNKVSILEMKCEQLETKNSQLMNDNRALKKMLDASKSLNLCKDIKIQKLISQCGFNNTDIDTENNMENNTESNNLIDKRKAKTMLFSDYTELFTIPQMNELHSTGHGQTRDSTFILKLLEFLYGDVEKLRDKCSGSRKLKGKTLITPTKKDVMENMLSQRVESEGVNGELAIGRCGRLNRLIGNSLYTIKRRIGMTSEVASVAPLNVSAQIVQELNRNQQVHSTPAITPTTLSASASASTSTTPQVFSPMAQAQLQQFDAFNYITIPFNYY